MREIERGERVGEEDRGRTCARIIVMLKRVHTTMLLMLLRLLPLLLLLLMLLLSLLFTHILHFIQFFLFCVNNFMLSFSTLSLILSVSCILFVLSSRKIISKTTKQTLSFQSNTKHPHYYFLFLHFFLSLSYFSCFSNSFTPFL